jgi:hypothetical protein
MRRLIVPSALAVLGLGAAFALLRSGTPPRPGTPLHPGATPALPVLVTEQARVRVVTLTDGLNQPWALAFLPGGDMLITERGGRMRLMHDGWLHSGSIGGLPAVDTRTQDGLMDLALHPRFVQNQLLYFTYSKPGERGDATALASAKFDGATLTDVRDLFVADAWSAAGGNSVSRSGWTAGSTCRLASGTSRRRRRICARTKARSEPHVDLGPGRHVREQAEGSRDEVEAEPRFSHAADRGYGDPAKQHDAQRECDQERRQTRAIARLRSQRQPVQSDQLLVEPPAGSATRDLFQQIADERLSRTRGVGASQQPQRKPGTDHIHPP